MPREFLLGVHQPMLERILRHRFDLYRHKGVIDATDLVALSVIGARVLDSHPALIEPADDRVSLNSEGRNEPAVDHIGPGDLYSDDRIRRNDERVVDVEEPLLSRLQLVIRNDVAVK